MTIAVAVYAYCPTVRILLRRSTAGQYATRRYAVYPMLNCAELVCANAIFKCW